MHILSNYKIGLSVFGVNPLYGFFSRTLRLHSSEHYKKFGFDRFNYYEFGTGVGNSLKIYMEALKDSCKDTGDSLNNYNIFAFDSFEGLPRYKSTADYNPVWNKGDFYGSEAMIDKLVKKSKFTGKFYKIKGYYEKSLTKKLQKRLIKNPPSIVNIDVDYFTSAKLVLKFLEPLLQDGTKIYFDDIYEYLGNQNKGEIKAIREFESKHKTLMPYYQHGIPLIFGKTFIFNRNK